jgi:spermidine/putrescine transport system substrate-binding protein
MVEIDPELAENPYIFPTEEFLSNVKVFRSLSSEEETEFTTQFQEVIGR